MSEGNSTGKSILPDLSGYPDSGQKRHAENLAKKLDLKIEEMQTADGKELAEISRELNQIYYEMNVAVGTIIANEAERRTTTGRWNATFLISILALVVSIIALFISLKQKDGDNKSSQINALPAAESKS